MKLDPKKLLLIAYGGIAISYALMFYLKYKDSHK
jgi:hypothetical protein